MRPVTNTLYFEKNYSVNIKDIHTTEDIDKIIEKKTGHKLELSNHTCDIIERSGNVFPVSNFDINARIDKLLPSK